MLHCQCEKKKIHKNVKVHDSCCESGSAHVWAHRTSAVHVAGCHRVHVASLEVKKKAGFRIVSLHAHQGIQDHLQTGKHLELTKKKSPFPWLHPSTYRPPTWLRCSIEFVSFPVFSSKGRVFSSELLRLLLRGLWIRTRAVTSIFPLRPNLGDHTFSSISANSVTVTTAGESWYLLRALLSLGLEPKEQGQRNNQLFKRRFILNWTLVTFTKHFYVHFKADGFWRWRDEVFFCPVFQWWEVMDQFLLHLLLTYTQSVPVNTRIDNYKKKQTKSKHTIGQNHSKFLNYDLLDYN